MATERTFIACKPDAVQRGLVPDIMARFERRGYKLIALKMKQATIEEAEAHYADLADRPFFRTLLDFISSAPIVCMVWEGKDVVKQGRAMIGATDPLKSAPGTIRGDYCIVTGKNIVHGSDSVESAEVRKAVFCARLYWSGGLGFGVIAVMSTLTRLNAIVPFPTIQREISIWFSPEEVLSYKKTADSWIYE